MIQILGKICSIIILNGHFLISLHMFDVVRKAHHPNDFDFGSERNFSKMVKVIESFKRIH